MRDITLQKIVFPKGEKLEGYPELFYKSQRLIVENNSLIIPEHCVVDFATYLNGCAANKWQKYTGMDNLKLVLCGSGNFTVNLVGYSQEPEYPVRRQYCSRTFKGLEMQEQVLEFPEIKDAFLAFELIAESDCVLHSACYRTTVSEEDIREVNLAIATTTFKKEDFIIPNVNLIKTELLDSDDEIAEHLYVNVVDNGRTLKPEQIEGKHVRLFFNDNVGGSGGFSRGMLEALRMKEGITHVLLMDDDVIILTESIRKTYTLLTLLKEEYRNCCISGAMLDLDAMWRMHEDIGLVLGDKSFFHAKPIADVRELKDILNTNRELPYHPHMYAGWWYCCIPTDVIREKGLSLPLFIRGDDVEYGLRCGTYILTMTGICVWHLGFAGKYSAHTNLYQEFRNMLIVQAAGQKIPDVDVFGRWKTECLRAALTYDYNGWEMLLLALEDYMKGPKFISEDHGTEILQRDKKLAEPMEPLSDIKGPGVVLDELQYSQEVILPLRKRAAYYLSYNGQKFFPGIRMTDAAGVMQQEFSHRPDHTAFHKNILVVNTTNRTGHVRTQDKDRFKKLMSRQKKDVKRYLSIKESLEKKYQDAYPYLVSVEFWEKYLKLK